MAWLRRILCGILVLLLLPAMLTGAGAVQVSADSYIRQILSFLLEERRQVDMTMPLERLKSIDPKEGERWAQIVEDWYYVNQEMQVHSKVLPDGLPQDDSLAIVVMGLRLNNNGSMTPELLDRLAVAIESARKYPNAYIICTGGATSDNVSMTEAGEMAAWLKICGIEESRIIMEDASYSTVENAKNTCEILGNSYKQIRHLAVITSDYHIRRSCLMFKAAALYAVEDGETPLNVVSSAFSATRNREKESTRTLVWGLAILAGVDMPE